MSAEPKHAIIEHEPKGQVVAMTAAPSALERVLDAARDPATDPDKLDRLLALYERMEARQAAVAFAEAMADAQEGMLAVSQDAANPQTKSRYASYVALDKAMRPIYTKHGFSLSFDTADGAPESMVRVICKVKHRSGASETHHLDMPADGKGAKGGDVMTKTHATMSAVTYARRGLLKMVFNIAEGKDVDDDGNGAAIATAAGPAREHTITDEQALALSDLIESVGAKRERLLANYKIVSLSALPARDYDGAVAALRQIPELRARKAARTTA